MNRLFENILQQKKIILVSKINKKIFFIDFFLLKQKKTLKKKEMLEFYLFKQLK